MPDPQPVRALISVEALTRNARSAAGVADVRRDAFGHGLALCAPVLTASGLGLLGDGDSSEGEVVDPIQLWGLPGGSGVPVMSLHGSVLSTKILRAGEGVSYGYTFRAAVDTRVALVSGGYAQGIVREVGNRVQVGVAGTTAPIVGRVAMDACVIDIGDLEVACGDEVVFFGDPAAGEPGLAAWTEATGLTGAEIVSLAGARSRRRGVR
ncbi:alanine racemase [Microbacterium protaetiae]|uniref:Alanine racemase n=1 Tax=Microbacterium protaetiae TaxID=2509458 RepID=A0A4P6EFZ1_9MICO|nr:alanine racemase C-terminal domain-containing protein [Microbacterium protaetiae]QAY61312.1 alanine racemase [Microbacterium protaetiae]